MSREIVINGSLFSAHELILISMGFTPFVLSPYPPCKICQNKDVIESHIDVDLNGDMIARWLCANGHKNELWENRRGDKRDHKSWEEH